MPGPAIPGASPGKALPEGRTSGKKSLLYGLVVAAMLVIPAGTMSLILLLSGMSPALEIRNPSEGGERVGLQRKGPLKVRNPEK